MGLILPVFLAVALVYYGRGKTSVVGTVSRAVDFVKEVYHDARTLEIERGISPTITLIQAAYESNFGLSQLSATYRNLFGIKKSSTWKGGIVNLPTREAKTDGTFVMMNQYFKTYPTYLDSMRDWADLLYAGYPLAYQAAQNGDLELFFRGLAKGKWGAYAGPLDGSYVLKTYSKEATSLLPAIKSALAAVA